mmetsp:Transcript_32548/g.49788  ORF Transcript_32548/g.49788 Transcript_32548/m.49788 type:complete len:97 (-) Transcript_32548:2376-2666(-)
MSNELAREQVSQPKSIEEDCMNKQKNIKKLNKALEDLEESLEEQNKNMERLNLQRVLVQKNLKNKANPYMTYVYVNMLDNPQPILKSPGGGTANMS